MLCKQQLQKLLDPLAPSVEYEFSEAITDRVWRLVGKHDAKQYRLKYAVTKAQRFCLLNEYKMLQLVQVNARVHHKAALQGDALLSQYSVGDSLAQLLRTKKLIDPLCVLQSLYNEIRKVHALGVVHGDIKPKNIVIENSRAILIDWGSAAKDGMLIQSLPYRSFSPSYALDSLKDGRGYYAARLDWYAYLVIASIVLEQQPPGCMASPVSSRRDHFSWVISRLPEAQRAMLMEQLSLMALN